MLVSIKDMCKQNTFRLIAYKFVWINKAKIITCPVKCISVNWQSSFHYECHIMSRYKKETYTSIQSIYKHDKQNNILRWSDATCTQMCLGKYGNWISLSRCVPMPLPACLLRVLPVITCICSRLVLSALFKITEIALTLCEIIIKGPATDFLYTSWATPCLISQSLILLKFIWSLNWYHKRNEPLNNNWIMDSSSPPSHLSYCHTRDCRGDPGGSPWIIGDINA